MIEKIETHRDLNVGRFAAMTLDPAIDLRSISSSRRTPIWAGWECSGTRRVTCHGLFPPSVTRVRPNERTD
ncbi:hypothetical protein ACFHYO_14200, partial [Paracoccus panacisoli]